jgi:indole-3-glycerol phosphate synthase
MFLDKIASKTSERLENAKKKVPFSEIKTQAQALPNGAFEFERAIAKPGLSFICEVKKASPSKGIIAEDFPYLDIARE